MGLRIANRTPVAIVRNPAPAVTDRALRYRANAEPPDGPRQCAFCGSRRNVEVGHVDGHEEHGEPENLIWTCRACNTTMGAHFRNRGAGRLTRQYNPSGKRRVPPFGAYVAAVMTMKGESSQMPLSEAIQVVHDTPASARSDYASRIWKHRRERGTDTQVPF